MYPEDESIYWGDWMRGVEMRLRIKGNRNLNRGQGGNFIEL
jgi:hypothetical protein